jgi:hypothetical protein
VPASNGYRALLAQIVSIDRAIMLQAASIDLR